MVLHEDWKDEQSDEDEAMAADLANWTSDDLGDALREWHEAFDAASDEQVSVIVGNFNPAYDPAARFGSDRGWAEWVREHLEAELQRRKTGSTAG